MWGWVEESRKVKRKAGKQPSNGGNKVLGRSGGRIHVRVYRDRTRPTGERCSAGAGRWFLGFRSAAFDCRSARQTNGDLQVGGEEAAPGWSSLVIAQIFSFRSICETWWGEK